MARDLRAKHKLCRKFGEKLCDSVKCPVVKRNYGPGVHGPKGRGRLSEYGRQLLEKQKAKAIYGILEKQFYGYYKKAISSTGNTAENLMKLLEIRLDNVVYRFNFAPSRRLARQLVSHRHILVNGKRVNIPSYLVKANDVISLKEKSKNFIQGFKTAVTRPVPAWLSYDEKKFEGRVMAMPTLEDQAVTLDAQRIIEFYSR